MRKTHILLWTLLAILFSLLLRVYILIAYSITHEFGIDSFFYHIEANVLLSTHRYVWWLNPLSFFGLYPYSDSPAIPTYIAMLSSLTGLPVELVIPLYNIFLVSFSIILMFFISIKISKGKVLLSFLIATVWGIAPILLPWTIWSIGERESLVYFIPLLSIPFFYFLNSHKKYFKMDIKMGTLVFLILIVISTIHLISLFLYSLVISYIIISLFKNNKRFKLNTYEGGLIKPSIYIFASVIMLYILFILNQFFDLPYVFSIKNYESTALFSGTNPFTILLNMGVSYSGGIGILFPIFFPIGYLYLVFKRRNDNIEKYFLLTFILILPITINRLYSRPVMVFLGTVFIEYGILSLLKKLEHNHKKSKIVNSKKVKAMILSALILSSAVFSLYMYNRFYEKPESKQVIKYSCYATEDTYALGLYQKYMFDHIWVSNDWLTAQRIQAYSNVPMQPGTAGSPLLNNPVYYSLVNTSVLGIKKSEKIFLYTSRFYYSTYAFNQTKDYWNFFKAYPNSHTVEQLITKYNIYYVVEFTAAKGKVLTFYSHGVVKSNFLIYVGDKYYKTFSNGEYAVYLI